jgi:N-acetylglucosamine kinase-like BadF-type ATPase
MSEPCDSTLTLAGIDGGGTRTRLALVRGDGCLLGFAEAGCCSFVELGRERARQALDQLWQSAWQSANSPPRPADALFIGTGSILSAADAQTNCELALALCLGRPGGVSADNDACNALAGALSGRPGLLLISGTGSVCYGRNDRGQTWRAGGWGPLLNDAGSAHALGLAAMIAATRAADGRGRPTALTSVVLETLALRDLKEIYRKLHHNGTSRAETAAMAPRIVALAGAGDTVAAEILDQGADGLVEMVLTVASRFGLERPELALSGGLITNAASYRQRFLDRLAASLPNFTLVHEGFAPVLGAVMLACQNATGHPPTPYFLENLRQSTAALNLNA